MWEDGESVRIGGGGAFREGTFGGAFPSLDDVSGFNQGISGSILPSATALVDVCLSEKLNLELLPGVYPRVCGALDKSVS
ncbi:hypothetical protein EYF80_011447 [Liparis tanakae]|uniref:Uncharacterized protein n=1 Tax=Liparis tanakae TaxID=230148 RepID=A0A4Z2IK91_9TELE|nr:hypothetical protein EYF80_011447 [Liparis tanakae]